MNLEKLFGMQRALDERITRDKGLEDKNLLPQKILAFQVELGELANEWRGFKFWSNNQMSRTSNVMTRRHGEPLKNPLLEEYVDCLHFILSIGLEIKMCTTHKYVDFDDPDNCLPILDTFEELFGWTCEFHKPDKRDRHNAWESLIYHFHALGNHLGFSWEQIERAYIEKNVENHARQDRGY